MLNEIMDYLTPRRMMSLGNLADHFEAEPEKMQVWLEQLDAAGRVRFALSRCAGACSSCSGCPSDEEADAPPPPIDTSAIVISLERPKEDDDDE